MQDHDIVVRLAAVRERLKQLAELLARDDAALAVLQGIYDHVLVLELDVDRKANSVDVASVDKAKDLPHDLRGEWTVEAAAAFLNVSQAYIHKLIEMGELDVRLRFADLQACEQAQR